VITEDRLETFVGDKEIQHLFVLLTLNNQVSNGNDAIIRAGIDALKQVLEFVKTTVNVADNNRASRHEKPSHLFVQIASILILSMRRLQHETYRRAIKSQCNFSIRNGRTMIGLKMKTLLLLRHAKSDWHDPGLKDFDRPLNKRGQKAAPAVGNFLKQQKVKPQLILSSPAERARQTTSLVMESARLRVDLRYDERLYGASLERLLEVLSQIEDTAAVVMMVGHNPGLEELLEHLTGDGQRMPTATLACLNLNIEKWGKVKEKSGVLEWLVKPRDLL
jgi:phosphohistidine phosphatase